jgi:hypothetical protein
MGRSTRRTLTSEVSPMKKALWILAALVIVVVGVALYNYLSIEEQHRREIAQLQEVIKRLNAEKRVAQLVVKERVTEDDGRVRTSFDFLEWDREGKPLPPVSGTAFGSETYVEGLVIKFENEYVEKGDALKGSTIVLFRRIFGSAQAPDLGCPIDSGAEGGVPNIYRVSGKPSPFEADLWKRFWYYAEHPEEAEKLGVRVAQIEAVGGRLVPGAVYNVSVEAKGGMNLVRTKAEKK